jgi:hypothetical protein
MTADDADKNTIARIGAVEIPGFIRVIVSFLSASSAVLWRREPRDSRGGSD